MCGLNSRPEAKITMITLCVCASASSTASKQDRDCIRPCLLKGVFEVVMKKIVLLFRDLSRFLKEIDGRSDAGDVLEHGV